MYTKKSEQEWKEILANWKNSGLSQTAYVTKHGLSSGSFWVWKKKLLGTSKLKGKKTGPSFVQFSPTNWGKIEICLNGSGAKVLVDRNDKETLNAVLATLMSVEHKG